MDSAQTRSLVSQASGTSEKTLGRKPRSGYCLRAVTCFLVFSVAGAGWGVKYMPGPEPHKGQHFINSQLPSKHSIHLLFPGFALLDNRTSVLGREGDGSVSRNNCSSLSCGQFHALQSLHSLLGHFHGWKQGISHPSQLWPLSPPCEVVAFDFFEVEEGTS